jgi:hypothetical protein
MLPERCTGATLVDVQLRSELLKTAASNWSSWQRSIVCPFRPQKKDRLADAAIAAEAFGERSINLVNEPQWHRVAVQKTYTRKMLSCASGSSANIAARNKGGMVSYLAFRIQIGRRSSNTIRRKGSCHTPT